MNSVRIFCLFLFIFAPQLSAQIATSLRMSKKSYLSGEVIIAEVIVTNHTGRDITLTSSRALPWLSFVVSSASGEAVATRKLNVFGAMNIKAGSSLAKRIDLNEFFLLNKQGNYGVSAIVRDPSEKVQGATTNRILFNINPGKTYWSQKVGIKNDKGSGVRELRVLTYSDGQKTQLYAQSIDDRIGTPVSTFLLGDVLLLRKPSVTLDSRQRMHVMYLVTPSVWVHYQISCEGKVISRDIHKTASQGEPVLMSFGDGSVRVLNSILYDPKAAELERKKIRKATDRPELGIE
jgi:hypothetical protein